MPGDEPMTTKTVLITGAGGVLGRAIAAAFDCSGATVFAADLRAPVFAGRVRGIALDVTDETAWQKSVAAIAVETGGLDVLVNAAGIHRPNIAFEDLSLDVWRQHFAVNGDGLFLGCREAIRHMAATKRSGAIVNLASGLAIKARATSAAYCASKAAALMTTRLAAQAGGPHGVRVNAILPGPVVSDMLMSNLLPGQDEAAFLARFTAGAPLGRMATPEDIAAAVLFLCSDAAGAITGVALPVDGGDMPGS
jgi:NAD(P)-dependent dehydrogenase (short-subunit alcohol dehydrogenase family)